MTVWQALSVNLKRNADSYCVHALGSGEVNYLAWLYEYIANVHYVPESKLPKHNQTLISPSSVNDKEKKKGTWYTVHFISIYFCVFGKKENQGNLFS